MNSAHLKHQFSPISLSDRPHVNESTTETTRASAQKAKLEANFHPTKNQTSD